jgi:hypothetical protein
MAQMMTSDLERCAEICHECEDACLRTIVHCLERGGEHASRGHQTLLTDCAALCGLSHELLHRQSARHLLTCRACAAVCRECAGECDRMGQGDAEMGSCARACRRCAEACEKMSEGG